MVGKPLNISTLRPMSTSKKKAATKKTVKPAKRAVKKVSVVKAGKAKVSAKKAIPKVAKKSTSKVLAKKSTSATKKAVAKKPAVAKKAIAKKAVKKTTIKKTVVTIPQPAFKNTPLLKKEPSVIKNSMSDIKDDRTRYSNEELKEFEAIILEKLDTAKKQFQFAKEVLNRKNDEGTDNTTGNVKLLEDGADVLEKESFSAFAARQQKFILQLENAVTRIKNGTYGICIVTGKLIPKERLRLVPHTQHTIEAKQQRK